MSRFHREFPELIGTDADPWTIHEDYVKHLPTGLRTPDDPEYWERPYKGVTRPSEDDDG